MAWATVVKRDGAHCRECGIQHRVIWRRVSQCSSSWLCADHPHTLVNPSSNLELDHRIPLSEGGSNDHDNLWLLCIDCHKRKTSAERSARLKRIFAEWRAENAA